MRNLTRFGTYGFMSVILAAQMLSVQGLADSVADKSDRAWTDTKKSARSVKRDAKKAGRKVTGQESKWENFKDSAEDTGKDFKDEAKHQKRKLERKAE
jgi:hypothetical protein